MDITSSATTSDKTTYRNANTPAMNAAAATSAARGFTGKAKRPMIMTPESGAYPSELQTPVSATAPTPTHDDPFKTPISPPTAYVNFLRNMPHGLASPPNSSGTLSRFPSTDSGESLHAERRSSVSTVAEHGTTPASPKQHPPFSRNPSTDSSASYSTVSTESTESVRTAENIGPSRSRPKPFSPKIIIPPTHFARPSSARTPRRLHIPASPFSATSVRSPMSARSLQSLPSPYTTSAASAGPRSASFPPRAPLSAREGSSNRRGSTCVRQTTTTTYTWYRRIPLVDPAPKGKRRKTTGSEEPPDVTPTEGEESKEAEELEVASLQQVKKEAT